MIKNIITTFVSSIVFGICYALIIFIFDREIDWQQIVITTIYYFIFITISYYIVPKIRKNRGHNKK